MRNREAAAQPSHESSPRYELRDRRINAIKTGEGTMKKMDIRKCDSFISWNDDRLCTADTDRNTTCSRKDGDTPAWKTYAKEDPVTLDWYVNYSWFDMGWGKISFRRKLRTRPVSA